MTRFIVSLIALLTISASALAGYGQGDAAYQRGDYTTALREFSALAQRGDARSQHRLGYMYARGLGVPKDNDTAIRWYRSAAEQGYAAAQYLLGTLYAWGGAGVAQNDVLAYMWLDLTARSPEAIGLAARGYRDDVVKRMSASQLAEARRLSMGWRAQPSAAPAVVPVEPDTIPHPEAVASGSGFFVSEKGHILTNHHVVKDCSSIRIASFGLAKQIASDAESDLSLLRVSSRRAAIAKFRGGRGVRTGEDIVVAGFPLQGLLSSDVKITKGSISSLAGLGNDRGQLQISAAIQSGNSGGPVLDGSGNVVGVVVAKINALKLARLTGTLPENVNFAISAGIARAFLDAQSVPYEIAVSSRQLATADIAQMAQAFTVAIECWQ